MLSFRLLDIARRFVSRGNSSGPVIPRVFVRDTENAIVYDTNGSPMEL